MRGAGPLQSLQQSGANSSLREDAADNSELQICPSGRAAGPGRVVSRPAMKSQELNGRRVGFVVTHDSENDGSHFAADVPHGGHMGLSFGSFSLI